MSYNAYSGRNPGRDPQGGRDSYSSYVLRSSRRDPRDREPERTRDTRGPDPRARRDRYDYNDKSYDKGYDKKERFNGSRSRHNDRQRDTRDNGRGRSHEPLDPDAGLTPDEIITKYEKKLKSLMKYPALEVFPVAKSQWGVKPKGFENVTSQRAKLSGLFPLPDSPGPVDAPKVEGDSGLLLAKSKIDPVDSRNSRIVIVKDVDFTRIDHVKVAEHFNRFVCSADLAGTALDNNIEKRWKTRDNKHVIIEFTSNVAATLALTMHGTTIPGALIGFGDNAVDLVLALERPGEYVVQCLPPYDDTTETADTVKDSPRKITIFVNKNVTESILTDALTTVAPLRAFQLLREVGTKDLMGIAYAEYYVDPKRYPNTKAAIKLISGYLKQTTTLDAVKHAEFSCIKVSNDKGIETSIQDCPIDVKTLLAMVRNEYVLFHPKLRVIQLINAVTASDLNTDDAYNFISQDVLQEASHFGKVVSWKLPRPAKDYASALNQPGLGKMYLEYEDEKTALSALMGLGGRSYNDRTVLCAFYSHDDYMKGML